MKKILFLIFLFPITVFSQNRYIKNGGSDSNTGLSDAQAWATIEKARTAGRAGQIAAGDTIFIKRGGTYYCADRFHGMTWWSAAAGGNSPSGTAGHPIVFDAYGTGDAPNMLFPNPASTDSTSRVVMSFEGCSYIVVRNLRSVDTRRMPISHILGAYTTALVQFGERGGNQEQYNSKVENCETYGTGLGVVIVGSYDSVVNCRFEEMGNVDAIGSDSYGANCVTLSGSHHYIVGNYMADAWAFSDAFSPFFNGGAIEAFNTVDSCFFGYNTIVNCSGLVEFGATAGASTFKMDTFVYNKILNVGDVSYVNVSGAFAGQPDQICFFNNDIVENDSSLFSGPYGGRLMHDFPTWPSGYAAVYRCFYNNGSPSASTVYVLKNNLIRNYNNFTVILTPSKTTHTYNGYNLSGGSSVGTSLSTGEANVTNMWKDTTSGYVQNWDFHLKTDIVGTTISGLTRDFFNQPLTPTTSQGIAQYILPPTNQITVPFRLQLSGGGSVNIGKINP